MNDLNAIVVAYESSSTIRRCVTDILSSDLVDTVTVWDNSPTDRTQDALAEISNERVRYIRSDSNLGFGGGVNAALRRVPLSPNGRVLVVNPDCYVIPSTVSTLLEAVEDPNVGLAAPAMVYLDGTRGIAGASWPTLAKELLGASGLDRLLTPEGRQRALRCLSFVSRGRIEYGSTLAADTTIDVDWVSGFCLMARRDVLECVDGFDESFFLYFEDVDLSRRVAELGLRRVVVGGADALHEESASTKLVGKSRHYWDGYRRYRKSLRDASQFYRKGKVS